MNVLLGERDSRPWEALEAHASGQSRAGQPKRSKLEGVVQADLNMPFLGANAADCPEVAVTDPAVRISVTGNIEEIEEVSTEAQHAFLAPQVEVLEERRVNAAIARRSLGAVRGSPERILSRLPIGTSSVRRAQNGVERRFVRTPPVGERTVPNDHGTVLIRPTEAPSSVVRVAVVWTKDGDGQS